MPNQVVDLVRDLRILASHFSFGFHLNLALRHLALSHRAFSSMAFKRALGTAPTI